MTDEELVVLYAKDRVVKVCRSSISLWDDIVWWNAVANVIKQIHTEKQIEYIKTLYQIERACVSRIRSYATREFAGVFSLVLR